MSLKPFLRKKARKKIAFRDLHRDRSRPLAIVEYTLVLLSIFELFKNVDKEGLARLIPEVLITFWENRSDTEKKIIVKFTLSAFVPRDQIKIIKPITQFVEDSY